MTYTVDSPIIHAPTGTLAEALAWLDIKAGAETEYATELWRLCSLVGIDPAILFAQAAHETYDFSSAWWQYRRNPAGIGITGDAEQNAASHIWQNGIEAARAHVVHMAVYAHGVASYVWLELSPFKALDPRLSAVTEAGYAGKVRTLADLTGKWATDPKYAEKIAAKANAIFPNRQEIQPLSITTGRVPYPDVIQSHLPASNPYVVEAGAPKIPEAVIWHRMLGTWGGTNSWMHMGKAATAYGVAVAATDGASAAGKIYEWIARTGWYGESSGPARGPYGDGLIYANEVGVASINRCSKAIEISGNYDTPLDEKARDSIAAITAYWADQRGIPWTEFPTYKAKGRSYVIWHNEITGMAYKECPGSVVMTETPALIERTKQIMKKYQEDAVIEPPTPEKPKPTVPWGRDATGRQTMPNGSVALAFLGEVAALRDVPIRYNVGSGKAKPEDVFAEMNRSQKAPIRGSYRSPNGTRWAFIEIDGGVGRAPLSAFTGPWPTT